MSHRETTAAVVPVTFSCVVALLCGCGSPSPSAPAVPPMTTPAVRLPLGSHVVASTETLSWQMKARGMKVARFDMQLSTVADAIRVVTTGRVTGMARFFRTFDSQTASIVERVSGLTRTSLAETRGQGRLQRVALQFRSDRVLGSIGDGETSRAFTRHSISDLVPISSESFLLALRAWRPAVGERGLAAVMSVENIWLIELSAESARVIDTALGEVRCNAMRGHARRLNKDGTIRGGTPRPVTVFISDDSRRLPIRIEAKLAAGSVVVSLIEHRVASAAGE